MARVCQVIEAHHVELGLEPRTASGRSHCAWGSTYVIDHTCHVRVLTGERPYVSDDLWIVDLNCGKGDAQAAGAAALAEDLKRFLGEAGVPVDGGAGRWWTPNN
jgi:hypothetical protein